MVAGHVAEENLSLVLAVGKECLYNSVVRKLKEPTVRSAAVCKNEKFSQSSVKKQWMQNKEKCMT